MKFSILPLALAAMLCPMALAQQEPEETPDTTPAPAAAPIQPAVSEAEAAPYLEVAMEHIMLHDELGTVLEKVNDKLSADAAVADTQDILHRLLELTNKEKQLPVPSAEVAAYITTKLQAIEIEELCERSVGGLITLLTEIDPPCHGSRELRDSLMQIANCLMGAE